MHVHACICIRGCKCLACLPACVSYTQIVVEAFDSFIHPSVGLHTNVCLLLHMTKMGSSATAWIWLLLPRLAIKFLFAAPKARRRDG